MLVTPVSVRKFLEKSYKIFWQKIVERQGVLRNFSLYGYIIT
jgi:hypothetical protein